MKYKIKSGDTLSQIAKDNNISVKKLAKLNNIKDVNKIFSGKTLDIPSREKPKTKKSSSVERVNQSDPFFIQEESGAFKSTAPKSTTKVTPAVQEKKIVTDKNNEFYSGNLPLAVRQLADDTKYDIFRNFLPKTTADKLSKKLFGEEENITKSDFSKEEFEVLRNIVKQNVLQDKFSVDYDDYRNFGAKGSSTIKDNPFELLNNPARSLQYTFGKGNINVDDKGDVYFTDQFNFNDAKMAENPQAYYGSAWDDEGFLKMDYDSGLRGLLSNQFKKVRNYKTRVGRGEGEGAATNLLIGNIKDFQNPINEIYASRKTGGITNYNKGGQMDIQQQTKNVAAQGRYGDSMLLHVNPAEVKGLSSAMPITVNPQTGQPEAFLPFLAPLLGSMGFSALAGTGLLGTTIGGLSAGALSGIGAGLAQTAVTGDIKEGLKAGLTAGLSTRILTGAGNTQIGQDALTTPTTSLPTDPTTGLNYSPTGALESAMTQNIATTNPALANPLQAGPTVTGTSIPQTLNPLGQANLNTFMSSPAADNYLQPFADDAIANFGAKAGNPTALESLGASFTDSTGGYDIGQGFSNIGTAAMDDPLALAGLGTTGTMYGMDMMQADYEEQMARMQAEREEKRRQNMLMNPEPTLYAGGGAIRGFNGEDDSYTGGDLPQIFAPARAAYDVNPNFMAGFNPETMYFNPATISAPASGLEAGGPPVVLDTYTGTKGGYGGDPLVISPEGRQASIDPFSAYTGKAPAGLVPYSTTLPSLDITGTDLGLPMGEGTPAPAGVVFDDEIVTLDEQEGENNFTDPNVIDPNNIGGGVYIPNIGNINIPAIMSGMGNFDIPESFVPMGGQDFGITQPIIDYQLANTFDLIPEEEIPVVTRKGGGDTLKPIPEGNKGLPNLPVGVRKEMGYMQAGGMTDMQNDPLTQEVTAFLLGESNNEEALNMFLTKYGNEAFMQLREAVLQSVVPGAQTQGQIKGNGEGGMDDDLRGMIGDKERIAVSQDEFIVPADVVSMLGDGSSDAGSKELYDMMDRVRKEKTGTTKQAPRLANAGGLLPA